MTVESGPESRARNQLDVIDEIGQHAVKAAGEIVALHHLEADYQLTAYSLVDSLKDLSDDSYLHIELGDTADRHPAQSSLERTVILRQGMTRRNYADTGTVYSFSRRGIVFEQDVRRLEHHGYIYARLFATNDEHEVTAHLVDLPIGAPKVGIKASSEARL